MSMDYMNYMLYNNMYNYMMSGILGQSRILSGTYGAYSGLYNNSGIQGVSFSDVYQNASQKLNIEESMDAIFEEAADKYDVPVMLLKAMGKAESGFDAAAVSPAGAQGVMQLMPATAEALGVSDPFDARSNIMGGARYISNLLKKYDGDMELALAAYNAGSGNVEKYGGVPPFKETQNYIRRIKEYMGTDLTIGKTVVTQTQLQEDAGSSLVQGLQSSTYQAFNAEMATCLVELMKLQMQSRMMTTTQSLFSGFDSGNLW